MCRASRSRPAPDFTFTACGMPISTGRLFGTQGLAGSKGRARAHRIVADQDPLLARGASLSRPARRGQTEEHLMDDKDLRQSVIEELDFTPSFDAADIGVAVENGVVTLTGHVRSYAEKLAVERAAQR